MIENISQLQDLTLVASCGPSVWIGVHFIAACIGSALTGYLAYSLSERRPTERGVQLLAFILTSTVCLSVLLEARQGAFAFLGGCVSGIVLFAPGANRGPRRRHVGWLIGVCPPIGPIVGLGLCGLDYYVIDPRRLHSSYDLGDFLFYGIIAGLLGALVVAITIAVAGRRPRG
jgi:hypothetical protein